MTRVARPFVVARAWSLLFAIDCAIAIAGLDRVLRWLERRRRASAEGPDDARRLTEMSAAYARARMFYPRDVACLQRAICLWLLAQRRRIPVALVIGVSKLPFASHAWIEYGNLPLFEDEDFIRRLQPVVRL